MYFQFTVVSLIGRDMVLVLRNVEEVSRQAQGHVQTLHLHMVEITVLENQDGHVFATRNHAQVSSFLKAQNL